MSLRLQSSLPLSTVAIFVMSRVATEGKSAEREVLSRAAACQALDTHAYLLAAGPTEADLTPQRLQINHHTHTARFKCTSGDVSSLLYLISVSSPDLPALVSVLRWLPSAPDIKILDSYYESVLSKINKNTTSITGHN